MIRKLFIRQSNAILNKLILTNSVSHFNELATPKGEIKWGGFQNVAFSLKNSPYEDIYIECLKKKDYSFVMIDGAIIQMMYSFDKRGKQVESHILAYYPTPHYKQYMDDPEDYIKDHFGDELFSEVYNQKTLYTPIRFDFDCDPQKYVENDHPYSHLTIGNNVNCRIPVSKPISPIKFIHFILRSFYFELLKEKFVEKDFVCGFNTKCLLSKGEKKLIHIGV